jgi:hypothetical protein
MAVPESATDVFDVTQGVNSIPAFDTGFTVDLALQAANITSTTSWRIRNRLTNANYLRPDDNAAEVSSTSGTYQFDLQTGYGQATNLTNVYAWLWKRAPNFFDVVAYTGNGTAGRTVSHNLGVAPEMIWAKGRDIAQNWVVYNPNGRLQLLNQTGAEYNTAVTDDYYGDGSSVIAPTATEFTIGSASPINSSGNTYIAYLFASLDGVSKVGSYTGTGSAQTIDCGFSSGARFVLIKETSGAGNWYLFDTERGITSTSNDGVLQLNTTSAQLAESAYGYDMLQPHNSGFTLTAAGNAVNFNNAEFIFYAIA